MAQRADSLSVEQFRNRLAPVVPLRIEKQSTGQNAISNIRQGTAATYRNTKAKARAARYCSSIVQKSSVLATSIGRRVQRSRKEKPLQIVSVMAGSAFVLGVILRVWTSKRNE